MSLILVGRSHARRPERVKVGGLTADTWLSLWMGCHVGGFSGAMRVDWPDGRPLTEQPCLTVRVFGVISELVAKEAARDK